jgi:hypothetical protein
MSRTCNGPRRPVLSLVGVAALSACVAAPPPPVNPFLGTWATPDDTTITIRPDTVVQHQADGASVVLGNDTCNSRFSFTYTSASHQALTALLPRQPNLDKDLSAMLPGSTYRVAQLRCDRGDHTYVLVNDHELVAIYRDGDIGAVERLVRR